LPKGTRRHEKLYLSPEFNSSGAEGKKSVKEFITNLFDDFCGGGIIATGSGSDQAQIVF
jgi:hypothetical protein